MELELEIKEPTTLQLYIFVQIYSTGNCFERLFTKPFCWLIALSYKFNQFTKALGVFYHNEMISLLIYNSKFKKIQYLFVKKRYRRLGIADKIIKKSDCDVIVANKNSYNFWQSKGFNREISSHILIKQP